jgi:WhiB family transcriptional regulator, redox-sensing transcriptional regulator
MYAIEEIRTQDRADEPASFETLADELRKVLALRTKGRCRDGHGTLTHLFFSDDLYDIARAKAICAKCPVSDLCLDTALARQEPWGVWGGQLISNGRIVTNKRPRGRPPRHPRPELVVDEVPVPSYLATAG